MSLVWGRAPIWRFSPARAASWVTMPLECIVCKPIRGSSMRRRFLPEYITLNGDFVVSGREWRKRVALMTNNEREETL